MFYLENSQMVFNLLKLAFVNGFLVKATNPKLSDLNTKKTAPVMHITREFVIGSVVTAQ